MKTPREKRNKTLIDTLAAAAAAATTAAKWIAADKKSVRQQLKRSIVCSSSVMRYIHGSGVGYWGVYGVERKEDNLGDLDGVCAPPFLDRRWRRLRRLGTRNTKSGGGREE
jgi:hypothetical protein